MAKSRNDIKVGGRKKDALTQRKHTWWFTERKKGSGPNNLKGVEYWVRQAMSQVKKGNHASIHAQIHFVLSLPKFRKGY